MIWLVGTLVYAIGFVACWRKKVYETAWAQADYWSHRNRVDGGNVCVAVLVASAVSWFWPVLLLVRLAAGGTPTTRGSWETFVARVGSEPKAHRIKRMEREAAARERHVGELERELGIR